MGQDLPWQKSVSEDCYEDYDYEAAFCGVDPGALTTALLRRIRLSTGATKTSIAAKGTCGYSATRSQAHET